METDYVKAQISGQKGEDRIIAVHRAWPLDDGEGVSVVGTASESPTSNFLQVWGGLERDADASSPTTGPEYHLFAVFDGHNGDAASTFAQSSLVPVLEAYLPVPEMVEGVDGAAAWAGAVQEAMVKTLLEIDRRFAARGATGGTTATLVLQIGQLVTCASVGNSRAVLDTGAGRVALTREHVVASNPDERERLLAAGCTLARLDVAGGGPAVISSRGTGPLRVWPGGVTLSRSLGDFSVGPALLAVPHVVAVMLPPAGGRIVLASDAVWKAGVDAVLAAAAAAPAKTAAHAVLKALGPRLRGDASVVVADTLPRGETFPQLAARLAQGGGGRAGRPAPMRAPSASRLWSLLKPRRAEEAAPPAPALSAGEGGGARVLTDCDVATLMGLTTVTLGEDDPQPIWYEDCVAEDLHQARADAWRIWPAARAMALSNPALASLRPSRSIGTLSELVGWSAPSSGAASPRGGVGRPPGRPSFSRRSCLKQPGESTDGGASDALGAGPGGASSDETLASPLASKRVSFAAGERNPLRRTSSEAVLAGSTPPSSWLGGLSDADAGNGRGGDAPAPLGGGGQGSGSAGMASMRSLSLPLAAGRPPRPAGAQGPPAYSGPDFTALIGSPTTRWRDSYSSTASVFTKRGAARERDRLR
ncbi:hypothetical protein ACKKBF_B37170 [Auxenochlorella protothecoides x Auxenochlorella symbiontica]